MRRLFAGLAAAVACACADGFSPPGGIRFLILPVFQTHAVLTDDLDLLAIRIVRIPSRSVVVDTTAAVDSAGNVELDVSVSLVSQTEEFEIRLHGIRSSDSVVLYEGFDTVTAAASASVPVSAVVPIFYVGPCGAASGCVVTVAPQDSVLTQGDSVPLRLKVDSAGLIQNGVPVSLESLDPTRVVLSGTHLRALSGISGGLARVVARIPGIDGIPGDEDTLRITVLPPGGASIGLSSTAVVFSGVTGQPDPAAQTVSITNLGGGLLGGLAASVTYLGGQPTGWLTASLSGTTAPSTLTLTPTPSIAELVGGTYNATVTVSGTGVTSASVSVTLTLADNPQITLSASTVALGGANPVGAAVGVTNGGTGVLTGLGAAVIYAGGQPTGWLAATLDATAAPTTLRLTGTIGSLAIGRYDATVTVSSALPGVTSRTVTVTLDVAPALVVVTPGYAALRLDGPGNTLQLNAAVRDAFGNTIDPSVVTWTSRDGAVAPTSGTGLVTASARGRATVVGTAGTAADSLDVLVGDPANGGDVLAFAVDSGRSFRTRSAGQAVPVDVVIDQVAAGSLVGSYSARLTWNAAVLRYDRTEAGTFALPTVNADAAGSGVLVFAAVDDNGSAGQPALARVWFTALAAGPDNRVLEILEVSGVSPTFTNYWLFARYVVSSGAVRVIP